MEIRTLAWLTLTVSLGAAACERSGEPTRQKPAWFHETTVSAKQVKRAFHGTTEVLVDIHNKTTDPVVIRGLEDPGAVVLVNEQGHEAKLHRLSVGVAKPVVVPPGATRKTSLLFEPTRGVPRRLRIYGQDHELP